MYVANNPYVNKVVYGGNTLIDLTDTTAVAGDVVRGKYFYDASGAKVAGNIQSQAAQTIIPTTVDQTIAAGQYLSGIQTIKGDVNLLAENIADGVTIFGITGTHKGGSMNLIFENVTVETTDFEYDGNYSPYDYVADIPLTGVTEDMIPFVSYSIDDVESGNFAPSSESYNGGIYIYANRIPLDDIIIPTILVTN